MADPDPVFTGDPDPVFTGDPDPQEWFLPVQNACLPAAVNRWYTLTKDCSESRLILLNIDR